MGTTLGLEHRASAARAATASQAEHSCVDQNLNVYYPNHTPGGIMVVDTKPKSLRASPKINPYFRIAALFVATFAMGALSTFPTAFLLRLIRLERTGVPLGAKLVPGAALDPVVGVLCVITAALSLVAVGWGYTKLSGWLERRRVSEFDRRHALQGLVLGAVLGAILISLSVGMMVGLDAASIAPGRNFVFSSSTIVPVLVVPVLEELIFRGIIFRIVEEMFGTTVGLVVSALLFGAAHLLNENATLLASVCVAIELGALLGAAYAVTRSLWFPIGVHAGWNFAEGNILGTPDSGSDVHGLFETTMTGHPLITGGLFGPEASLITPLLSTIAAVLLYKYAREHGLWHSRPRLPLQNA